jgi:hypothetical protein
LRQRHRHSSPKDSKQRAGSSHHRRHISVGVKRASSRAMRLVTSELEATELALARLEDNQRKHKMGQSGTGSTTHHHHRSRSSSGKHSSVCRRTTSPGRGTGDFHYESSVVHRRRSTSCTSVGKTREKSRGRSHSVRPVTGARRSKSAGAPCTHSLSPTRRRSHSRGRHAVVMARDLLSDSV